MTKEKFTLLLQAQFPINLEARTSVQHRRNDNKEPREELRHSKISLQSNKVRVPNDWESKSLAKSGGPLTSQRSLVTPTHRSRTQPRMNKSHPSTPIRYSRDTKPTKSETATTKTHQSPPTRDHTCN